MNKFVTRVSYEWDLESVDEYDDIIDHDFHDACPAIPTDPYISLVLVRSVANGWSDFFDDSGNIIDRSWAYVRDGVLPETFDCGTAVPKRFHQQLRSTNERGESTLSDDADGYYAARAAGIE